MHIQNKQEGRKGRFELLEGTEKIGYLEYDMQSDRVLRALQTEVKPEFEGQGAGMQLFNALIEFVKQHNLKVNPVCGFVKKKIGRNDAMKDLIAKEED